MQLNQKPSRPNSAHQNATLRAVGDDHPASEVLGVAVIGAGYWGPNLARNAAAHPATRLAYVCDLDADRAHRVASTYAGAAATADFQRVLDDPLVEAVAIATPPSTHARLAIAALRAGKHVLVEKPLADSIEDAEAMIATAERHDRVLMCDHTYCYTPAVQYLRSIVHAGDLGDLQFIDSVRINLGLVQRDVDVVWDLAPHDLSILDAVLPPGTGIRSLSATGADPVGAGQSCVAYLSMELDGGAIAHVHVNWLSPTKVRRMTIGGSRRTVVWDDLDPVQRVSVFDRGVDVTHDDGPDAVTNRKIAYRVGDMVAPALREREGLAGVFDELVASIREHRQPLTDGRSGLRVLRMLQAARASINSGGRAQPIDDTVMLVSA
jgi:predicted dehydrogenase